jgi:hypothetical protein
MLRVTNVLRDGSISVYDRISYRDAVSPEIRVKRERKIKRTSNHDMCVYVCVVLFLPFSLFLSFRLVIIRSLINDARFISRLVFSDALRTLIRAVELHLGE